MFNEKLNLERLNLAVDELKEAVGGRFWTGPNLEITEDYLLPAANPEATNAALVNIKVKLNQSHFPKAIQTYEAAWLCANISNRSRYAQVGFEGSIDKPTRAEWEAVRRGEEINIILKALNLAHRPLYLPQGTGITRFYSFFGAQLLKGDSLEDKIRSGAISVHGISFEELIFSTGTHELAGIKNGLILPLNDWRRVRQSSEPLNLDSTAGDYRQNIDSILETFAVNGRSQFWIAETPPVTLNGASAVLGRTMGDPDRGFGWAVQTGSVVIEAGQTDWPIRVEGISTKPATVTTLYFFE